MSLKLFFEDCFSVVLRRLIATPGCRWAERVGGKSRRPHTWLPALLLLLSSCSGAQLLSVPFDPGGRSLNSPAGENSPKISGNFVVFSSDRRGGQEIYLYDIRTRSIVELPGLNALDMTESSPAVSENGQWIVFVGSRQGRTGIYFYNRATRQLRNLTENLAAEVRNPTISADGNLIAFESNARGQWDIVFINRDGLPVPNLPR